MRRSAVLGQKFPALSFSSWFCVPEQGMKDLEILCRASCFLVKATNPSFRHKYHVLTVSHAAAPWKWPKYYPDAWLQEVNEKHTHYTMEMRYENGEFYSQTELIPQVYHHSKRDFSVMHIEKEETVMSHLMGLGIKDSIYSFAPSTLSLETGMKLQFHGHEVMGVGFADPDNDGRKSIPKSSVKGLVNQKSAHQIFARTLPASLENGMCGGPVVFSGFGDSYDSPNNDNDENSSSSSSGSGGSSSNSSSSSSSSSIGGGRRRGKNSTTNSGVGSVVGLVEGIVPIDHPSDELRGNAVFVEAEEMIEFLEQIEAGKVSPVVGGQVLETVGQDQDPSKMDFDKFL